MKEETMGHGAEQTVEEPGILEEVARQARDWFSRYLVPAVPSPVSPRSMHAV